MAGRIAAGNRGERLRPSRPGTELGREAHHVRFDVRRRDGQVTVEVTDDGPGVPPAERDRVFERFVRLEAGAGRNGLGLPIARAVARAHRGDLNCENAPAGARFVLRIPAQERVPLGNTSR